MRKMRIIRAAQTALLLPLLTLAWAACSGDTGGFVNAPPAADAGAHDAYATLIVDAARPPADAARDAQFGPPDAAPGDPCAARAYRGGAAGTVVCPGTTTCDCPEPAICCMDAVDAPKGRCEALTACRTLALQCDGPEDCTGGVCCLEDRPGGGSSCKSAAQCAGRALCRTDADCATSSAGPHCEPANFDKSGITAGLDYLVGLCGP